ncbi:prophage MuSo2 protein [Aurantimonas sp. 22II-16-19i]|nr:prophage MuSo2 protein [Aurantimonas sp. 22II-16-19i]
MAVSTGDVVVALAAGIGAAPAQEWIKIAPRGRVGTRDGRSYAFDPEMLAARFNSDDVKVPVDFEHGTVYLASKGQRSDAIGWIEELVARDDGLYGRVEWLDAGKTALRARTHRYVSPTFPHDAEGNAVFLHSVALVTAPALANMPALAGANPQQPSTDSAMSDKIAAALGLAAGTSEAAILAAIPGLLKKLDEGKVVTALGLPASADETAVLSAIADLKKKPEGDLASLRAELSTTQTELAALQATTRKGVVDTLLDTALKEKRIYPAQRESYASLCATDAGLTQVSVLLAATPPALGASGLDGKLPGEGGMKAIDPVALAAKANAYLSAQTTAGNPISYIDAFAHVQAEAEKEAGK